MRRRLRAAPLLLAVTLSGAAPLVPGAHLSAQASGTRAPAVQPSDTVIASAERAARAWLSRLDAQLLDSAWVDVAGAMRGSIAFDEWAASLRALRTPLPARFRRNLLRAEQGGVLFGAQSVWLTYRIVDLPYRETLVLIRERGRWRIAGYGLLL